MKLLYNVPDDLEPYLSVIPEEKIMDMITIALKNAVENRSMCLQEEQVVTQQVQSAPAVDYSELVEQIKQLMASTQLVATSETPVTSSQKEEVQELVKSVVAANVTDDIEEEEAGYINDFLSSICK